MDPEPVAESPLVAYAASEAEAQMEQDPSTAPVLENDKDGASANSLTELTIDEILSPMTLESFEISPMPLPVAEAAPVMEAEQPAEIASTANSEAESSIEEAPVAEAEPEPDQTPIEEAAVEPTAAADAISATAEPEPAVENEPAEPVPAVENEQKPVSDETAASDRVSELIAQLSATSGQDVPLQESPETKPSFTLEVPLDPVSEPASDPAPSIDAASEPEPVVTEPDIAPETAETETAASEPKPAAEAQSEQAPADKTEGAKESESEPAKQDDEVASFFNTPNREIDIPTEKQGFFARFRNKDK